MSIRLLTFALVAATHFAWLPTALAQQPVPLGPELQANTYTTGGQGGPAVASDGAGNFVVVWTSLGSAGSDTDGYSIQGQRYDGTGTPLGGEFQVNTYTTGGQGRSAVATDNAGNFVVAWFSYGSAGSDTSNYSVQGQRYDSTGAPLGGQFQVNTYTTGGQGDPAVASEGAGNFVVVWMSAGSAGSDTFGFSIQGQRYDSTGTAQGGEFQVNTYTTSSQFYPAVATDSVGNFVVVWQSNGSAGSDAGSYSVQGQRYDSTGAPLGGQFQANTYTTGGQYGSAVASDSAGNFVVVWTSQGSAGTDTSGPSIQGQRYDSTGAAQGGEFQVNTYTTNNQRAAAVATDGAGNFVVVWYSNPSSGGNSTGVEGQRFDSTGAPLGGQFQVNTYTTFVQAPAVATDGAGNFVVMWGSAGSAPPGSDTSYSVQGQRFAPSGDLLPGRSTIIKPGTLAKFVAKPVPGETFALPSANPVAEGGSLRIFDTGSTAGDNSYTLPLGASWKGLGNPAGSKGYKYKGAGTPSDPCKVVLVKETVIKAVCKGSGVTLAPPFTGNVGIILSLGTTEHYCAQFGGDDAKNDATLTRRKNAPAPGACP